MSRRRIPSLNLVFLVLGIALFVLLILKLDPHEVGQQLKRAGWALVPAFIAYTLNLCASTMAWREAIQPGAHGRRIPFGPLLAAFWAGHAINGVGIGGIGEVFKGTLLARRIPAEESVAALVIYNYMNGMVTIAFAVIAPAIALFAFDLPRDVVAGVFGLALLFLLGILLLRTMLRRGMVGRLMRSMKRLPFMRQIDAEKLEERGRVIDERFAEFRARRPASFRRIVAWFAVSRLMQVAETWVMIYAFLPDRDPWWLLAVALVSRSLTHLVAWATAFVPARVGTAEGGTAALFELLGIGANVGLSFAILRRIRRLLGIAVGFIILGGMTLKERRERADTNRNPSPGRM